MDAAESGGRSSTGGASTAGTAGAPAGGAVPMEGGVQGSGGAPSSGGSPSAGGGTSTDGDPGDAAAGAAPLEMRGGFGVVAVPITVNSLTLQRGSFLSTTSCAAQMCASGAFSR
jgi:hypothetical protein